MSDCGGRTLLLRWCGQSNRVNRFTISVLNRAFVCTRSLGQAVNVSVACEQTSPPPSPLLRFLLRGRGGSAHKPTLVVHGLRAAVVSNFRNQIWVCSPRGTLLPSLRGRRLKGKGKGVLGARETRGTQAISYPNINEVSSLGYRLYRLVLLYSNSCFAF